MAQADTGTPGVPPAFCAWHEPARITGQAESPMIFKVDSNTRFCGRAVRAVPAGRRLLFRNNSRGPAATLGQLDLQLRGFSYLVLYMLVSAGITIGIDTVL